jgi:hypothetical protein
MRGEVGLVHLLVNMAQRLTGLISQLACQPPLLSPLEMDMQKTSLDAYKSVNHQSMMNKVMYEIEANGASTCDELEIIMDGRHQSISATLTNARKQGLIVDTGERRPTRSGRQAIVWDLKINHRIM